MTLIQAEKILNPDTSAATLEEIDFLAASNGQEEKAQAIEAACIIGAAAIREKIERDCECCTIKAERDAAISQLKNHCWSCANADRRGGPGGTSPMLMSCPYLRETCKALWATGKHDCPHWRWDNPTKKEANP